MSADEVLHLVTDMSITKLGVDAIEARLAKVGTVAREVFPPNNPGVKLRASAAEHRVEALFTIGKRDVPVFHEIQLNFSAEAKTAADARFAKADAHLRTLLGKPMSTEPAQNQVPSVVFKLKKRFELYLTEEPAGEERYSVQVWFGISSED